MTMLRARRFVAAVLVALPWVAGVTTPAHAALGVLNVRTMGTIAGHLGGCDELCPPRALAQYSASGEVEIPGNPVRGSYVFSAVTTAVQAAPVDPINVEVCSGLGSGHMTITWPDSRASEATFDQVAVVGSYVVAVGTIGSGLYTGSRAIWRTQPQDAIAPQDPVRCPNTISTEGNLLLG